MADKYGYLQRCELEVALFRLFLRLHFIIERYCSLFGMSSCVFCRSTYDFRPPFKVYTTVEEDQDTANKVTTSTLGYIEGCTQSSCLDLFDAGTSAFIFASARADASKWTT